MPTHSEETRARAPVQMSNAITLPEIVQRAGTAAVFPAEEFFYGNIRNQHTRVAYKRAVHQFIAWCESCGLEGRTSPPRVKSRLERIRLHLIIFHGHGSAG